MVVGKETLVQTGHSRNGFHLKADGIEHWVKGNTRKAVTFVFKVFLENDGCIPKGLFEQVERR